MPCMQNFTGQMKVSVLWSFLQNCQKHCKIWHICEIGKIDICCYNKLNIVYK